MEIEVLIKSAQDLKNVKHLSKMKAYAVVYVDKEVDMAKTHVDEEGETNPTWNEVVKVRFHKELLNNVNIATLKVDIYAHGHVREKLVGSSSVLLCDVLKGGHESESLDNHNPIPCMTIHVWSSGRSCGFLNLQVPPIGKILRESLSVVDEKLGERIVLLGSRPHSALNLALGGGSILKSSTI
ncbi:hypothetical protein AQUCO_05100030v1 [Aquilegia coerulea]|uniref:C2 domain-containing protein n=1 Tax=Aquilegia coerulea TaxID=218851 RepID=A0A2G5CIX2_AQUCA|nr:hypothetical protein AQUCO_05100030v1 [Aquilegia coerulea]